MAKRVFYVLLILITQLIILGHNVIAHHHHDDHIHGDIPNHTHDHNDDSHNYHTFSEFVFQIDNVSSELSSHDEIQDRDEDFTDECVISALVSTFHKTTFRLDTPPPIDDGFLFSRHAMGAYSHRGPPNFA